VHPGKAGGACAWILGMALALSSCGEHERDPRLEDPQVQTATIAAQGRTERTFTGVVTARVQSDLGFRVAGKVVERLVDTGQTVRAGQALMRMDPVDYVHGASIQKANLAAARARYQQAAADEVRYRGLVASGVTSRASYDQIKATADSAAALVEAARAQLKLAQNETDYATLRADAEGTVVQTLAEVGQVVGAGQTVVRLAHSGPREATVDLPEMLRPTIGSPAEAVIYGQTHRGWARLRQLSDAADPATRTFEARFVLDGDAATAPLGSTVSLSLPDDSRHTAMVVVPIGALDDEGNGFGVWVIGSDSTVAFHRVAVARIGEETAELSAGVKLGDRVVALGGHSLHEGQRVRLMPGNPQSP